MTTPKKGDRVRVTLEGPVTHTGGDVFFVHDRSFAAGEANLDGITIVRVLYKADTGDAS